MTPSASGFDWKGLKQDSLVVDVGGGIGSFSLALAKENPHLKFVVQDRGPVVEEGIEVSDLDTPFIFVLKVTNTCLSSV